MPSANAGVDREVDPPIRSFGDPHGCRSQGESDPWRRAQAHEVKAWREHDRVAATCAGAYPNVGMAGPREDQIGADSRRRAWAAGLAHGRRRAARDDSVQSADEGEHGKQYDHQ